MGSVEEEEGEEEEGEDDEGENEQDEDEEGEDEGWRARRSTTVMGTSFLLRRCANADADVADGCFCSFLLLGVLVQSLTRFRFYLTDGSDLW